MLRKSFVPDERTLLDWITRIHAQGIRRPGFPADRWAEGFCRVSGKASLYDLALLRMPPAFTVQRRIAAEGESRGAPPAARAAGFCYDPRRTMENATGCRW